MDQEMEAETSERSQPRGGGDPLAAMYILAAIAMGIGFAVITVLIFLPSNLFDRSGGENVYTPGAGTSWENDSPVSAIAQPPGIREVEPGVFIARLDAYNWEFEPKEIRVPVGSRVIFRARSRQDYHGLALVGTPIVFSLAQNEMREESWTFEEPGEYLFVCSEYCGGGHVGMNGRVIVE